MMGKEKRKKKKRSRWVDREVPMVSTQVIDTDIATSATRKQESILTEKFEVGHQHSIPRFSLSALDSFLWGTKHWCCVDLWDATN